MQSSVFSFFFPMKQKNSIHFYLHFKQSMENSNIWAEARCKGVIPSRAVDNIITKQGRKAFDGIIFLLLFVVFNTLFGSKRCLNFSNADSDKLINIS